MKDAKVVHKPTIFLLTDSLASVTDVYTVTQGGKTITARSAMLLVRRDGKWRAKAMAEGGWGDLPAGDEAPKQAAPAEKTTP
jgi:stress response protein SCP2